MNFIPSFGEFFGGPWDGQVRRMDSRYETVNHQDLGWPRLIAVADEAYYELGELCRDGVRRYRFVIGSTT
jgi:hypothetical protein